MYNVLTGTLQGVLTSKLHINLNIRSLTLELHLLTHVCLSFLGLYGVLAAHSTIFATASSARPLIA